MKQPFWERSLSSHDPVTSLIWEIFSNATLSVRADIPAGVACSVRPYASTSRWSTAISERSGTAVKGLTLAPRDAMTPCGAIVAPRRGAGCIGARGSAEKRAMTKKTEGGPTHPPVKSATRLVAGGRDATANHGFVNPPVYHASTVLYPTAEDFLARRARYLYGRRGTPTSEALENALRALEGPACAGVALLPS